MKYYIDISSLQPEDYIAAGDLAAKTHNDHWLCCDVLREGMIELDPAAVVVEYKNVKFQVVLEGLLLQKSA